MLADPIQASAVVCTSVGEAKEALSDRTGAVVVVPVYDAYDDVVQCLESVLRHTPADVDLLLVDDGSRDLRIAGLSDWLHPVSHRIVVLRHPRNQGYVRAVNDAFAAAGRRDVLLLNSDVIVGLQWFERLREAAYSDSRVATVTPLTNHGSIVSVPYHNRPSELPPGWTPARAAEAILGGSNRRRPALPTCIGHCTYIKRVALDLVGGFDESFSPGYGEEVDFSQRCTLAGLAHICADDVFVYHRGSGSFGRSPEVEQLRREHEDILARRYPYYHHWIGSAAHSRVSTLRLAIGDARRALFGLTVAVDATCLGDSMMGTQRMALETIRALARHPRVAKVVAVVPKLGPDYFLEGLRGHDRLSLVAADAIEEPIGADVAYRPVQAYAVADLDRLRAWGDRVVIAQLDLIAFNSPAYFPDWRVWRTFRDITRLSLAAADGVAFLSEHAERETRAAGLVAPGQSTRVVHCGTDHTTLAPGRAAPASLPPETAARGFVLCLGTDYRHKNRPFALRVFRRMVERGYGGDLVLVGPRMPLGSSRSLEAEYLLAHPWLADRVALLGHVSEAERLWLFRHAALVLHPTLYEGFGLVPFEATQAGVACLTSTHTSLAEIIPPEAEIITDWDPEAVAAQAMAILGDAARRARSVEALERRARDFTWDRTAEQLVALFESVARTVRGPEVTAVEGESGRPGTAASRAAPPANPLGDLVQSLYPAEFHEALRAIGQRRVLRGPFVGFTVGLYRTASALRTRLARLRRRPTPRAD